MTIPENIEDGSPKSTRKLAALLRQTQDMLQTPEGIDGRLPFMASVADRLTEEQKLELFQDNVASDANSVFLRMLTFKKSAQRIETGLFNATAHHRRQNEDAARKAWVSHQWHDDLSAETKVTISYQKEGEPEEFVRCTLGTIPEGLPNPYRVKLGWPSAFVAPNRENSSKE
jgi:hypothetical protein